MMRDKDHIAAMAMMGLLANSRNSVLGNKAIVLQAYTIADEFEAIMNKRKRHQEALDKQAMEDRLKEPL